jgi:hypothetical protein
VIDLKKTLLPADVLVFYNNPKFTLWPPWQYATDWAIAWGIQQDAEDYLSHTSDFYGIHVEFVAGPQHLYRAVPGTIGWETIDQLVARGDKIKVFRPTFQFPVSFGQDIINAFESITDYTDCGFKKQIKIIGSQYDEMADLSLFVEAEFSNNPDRGVEKFDEGSGLFCSCGTALAFEYWRVTHGQPYPKLFSKIQHNAFAGAKWSNNVFRDYANGIALSPSSNFPAVWANTATHFNGELVYVGQNF